MYSQAYSRVYFTNTCAHTDTYFMGKADVNSKIKKEERKKPALAPYETTGYCLQSSESVSKVT